jgi:serine/threonine protein kinase
MDNVWWRRVSQVYDLLASMFDSDPKTRITLPEILAHPFFNGMSDVDKSVRRYLSSLCACVGVLCAFVRDCFNLSDQC